MIRRFCDLPDPNTCSFEYWANAVRDLLCQRGYQWDNLRVVAPDTLPSTFSALFDDLGTAIVIERSTPAKVYYWNGIIWEQIELNTTSEENFLVFHAHSLAAGFPYGYGSTAFLSYTTAPILNTSYGTLGSGVWTCVTAGWYRIFASYTLRMAMTAIQRTGGNPICTNAIKIYRGITGFDHRTNIGTHGDGLVQFTITDFNPRTFDVKLPQDAAPGVQWTRITPYVEGLTYVDVGEQIAIKVESLFVDMSGARQWGVGGGAVPAREMWTIERVDYV